MSNIITSQTIQILSMKPQVSIIYVYYNTPLEIVDSISSIKQAIGRIRFEIIIVNNNSPLPLPKLNKKITVINSKKNLGFAKGVNIASRTAKGDLLLVTNPDTVFSKDSITEMVKKINSDKTIGAIGPKMVDMNNKTLPTISGSPLLPNALFAFSIIDRIWPGNYFSEKYWMRKIKRNKELPVDIIGGACFCVRKTVFDNIHGFDERFFMYFEEADLFLRIKKLGLKVVFFPKAKIVHLVGRSNKNKELIQKMYEESRYKFLEKYHGKLLAFISELFLRATKINSLILILIVIIALFMNLHRITTQMLFIGDFGRDYLAALNMILTGKIPLLGISSSVKWLHQGPLSIYFIGISLFIGAFRPYSPAVFYGIIGVLTVIIVYLLGSTINKKIGLLSALFYATSPLIIINARMPYHTSSIPFFASLFFLIVLKIFYGNRKLVPLASFLLGILMLLELSNIVIFPIIFILLVFKRVNIFTKKSIFPIGTFLLGIAPFLIYDVSHNFIQTIGLPLWVLNRFRLFLGFSSQDKVTSSHIGDAAYRITQQLAGIIYPYNLFIFIGVLIVISTGLLFYKKTIFNRKITIVHIFLLWLFVPLLSYLLHTEPGTAYFPLIFPPIALFIGMAIHKLLMKQKLILPFFIILCFVNVFFTVKSNYFLISKYQKGALPPFNYAYGIDLATQEEAIKAIVVDAHNKPFQLLPGGFLRTVATGIDNYKYLTWYFKGKISNNAKVKYTVYEDFASVTDKRAIIFSNNVIYIEKNETN